MNTIEHLRKLFEFNEWANRRIVFALRTTPGQKALQLLSHLLVTEKEYFERLYGKDSTDFDFWQDFSLENCQQLARENAENYEKLLRDFDEEGLDIVTKYKTSEAGTYKNTYRELLTHVLFHSMNHRGQINSVLREAGFEPIAIDYIIYLRLS